MIIGFLLAGVWAKIQLNKALEVPPDAFTPQPFPVDPETIFTVPLGAPGPWLSFAFRNQTTQISQLYRFIQSSPNQETWLHLVDGFCIGDTFSIYVDGQLVGLSTPTDSDSCQTNTTDPRVAWADQRGLWSRWEGKVGSMNQPGEHLVTLFVEQSPFVAGMAFARFSTRTTTSSTRTTSTRTSTTSRRTTVPNSTRTTRYRTTTRRHGHHHSDYEDSSSDEHGHHHHHHSDCHSCPTKPPPLPCHNCLCPQSLAGLKVITSKHPWRDAEAACQAHGLRLAKLTLPVFLDATRLIFECLGPRSRAWIASWWGDSYAGACLELEGGDAPGGGSINVPASCSDHIAVLCQ